VKGEAAPRRGPPSAPALIANRYAVTGAVGKGGMGEVLRVEDLLDGRKVLALKRFRIDSSRDATDLFRREFLTLAQLRHPNVAQVFDFGTIPETGEAYFTSELVEGIELFEATQGISWAGLADIVVELCRGLAYVHARGLVHRDVKPSNVLVVEEGGRRRVKLIDFGLATESRAAPAEARAPSPHVSVSAGRAAEDPADPAREGPGEPAAAPASERPRGAPVPELRLDTGALAAPESPAPPAGAPLASDSTPGESTLREALTVRDRAIRGTVHYVSPEVASGLPAGRASDLYALGVTLFQLVTRELPFHGASAREVLAKHIALRPPSPRALRPDCPEALERIILRLLEKDPARRYSSADHVIGDLAALAGRAIPVETRETEESYVLSGRLVGRDAEMRALVEGLERAFGEPPPPGGPGPSLYVVSGETGVGKTRLLLEWKRHVQVSRIEAIEAACDPGGSAYAPLALAARKLLTLVGGQADALLGPSAPLVRRFAGEEEGPRAGARDAERERLRLFDAVATFVIAATYARPTVIFLHELERADDETVALAAHLARAIGLAARARHGGALVRPRVLLVASLDEAAPLSGPLGRALAALEEEELAQRVRLAPLGAEDVERLVTGMLGLPAERRAEAAALARRVLRETGGNPFLIEEAMKSLLESGTVRAEAGGFRIARDIEERPAPAAPPAAPSRIREVFRARISGLSEELRRTLEALAVLRRPCAAALVAAVEGEARGAGGAPREVEARLRALLRRGLVVEEEEDEAAAAGGAAPRYRFSHELLRRVAYEATDAERRRALHAAAGAALERPGRRRGAAREAGLAAALVEHFGAAGEPGRVFEYARQAGDEAREVFANERAAAFYERALEAARAAGAAVAAADLAAVLESLGRVRERLGDHAGAAACFRRVLDPSEGCAAALGAVGHARIHRRLGESLAARGGHDQALESFGAGLRLLGQGDRINSVEGAKLLGATASTYVKLGLYDMAVAFCKSGLGWLGEEGAGSPEWAAIQNTIGVALSCTGRYDEAAAQFEVALAAREREGDPEAVAQTLNNLGAVFVETGQVGRAIAFFEQALERCERTGDARGSAEAAANLGSAYAALGQEERAAGLFARALLVHERIGDPEALLAALARLGALETEAGEYVEACGRLERVRRLERRAGPSRAAALAQIFAGRLLGRLGDLAASEESLRGALALAEKLGLAREEAEARLILGRLLRVTGRLDDAERELSASLALYERLGNDLEAAGATIAVLETLVERGDLDLAQLVARKLDPLTRDARAGRLLARLDFALGKLALSLAARAALEGGPGGSGGGGSPGSGAVRVVGAITGVGPPPVAPRGLKDQRIGEAVRHFERAREAARSDRRPELVWRAEHALAQAFEMGGAPGRALSAAVRAMDVLRDLYARVPAQWKESYLADPARQSLRLDFRRWREWPSGDDHPSAAAVEG
jgi:serine/threonine protein kinase/tetratricopeptide (TPR) repeat protein